MLVKLREFPIGALVVWQEKIWKKIPCKIKDHFCLQDDSENPTFVYLHRDTYVEPVLTTESL